MTRFRVFDDGQAAGEPKGTLARIEDFASFQAAGAVHDLGNLIQVAVSAVTIAARTPDMPAEHARAIFARAQASLDHAGALVRQTVRLMRGSSIAGERSDVGACLADVLTLVDDVEGARLRLAIDVAPDLPEARCDPLGLQCALLNLVFNGRDAMAGSGTVRIAAREIPGGADMVELRVSDSGTGMSPATVARAFEPFFSTKADGLGGIGLPMVAHFVRQAGGEVAIDSEPGVGTTVTMRLPTIARGTGTGLPAHMRADPQEKNR